MGGKLLLLCVICQTVITVSLGRVTPPMSDTIGRVTPIKPKPLPPSTVPLSLTKPSLTCDNKDIPTSLSSSAKVLETRDFSSPLVFTSTSSTRALPVPEIDSTSIEKTINTASLDRVTPPFSDIIGRVTPIKPKPLPPSTVPLSVTKSSLICDNKDIPTSLSSAAKGAATREFSSPLVFTSTSRALPVPKIDSTSIENVKIPERLKEKFLALCKKGPITKSKPESRSPQVAVPYKYPFLSSPPKLANNTSPTNSMSNPLNKLSSLPNTKSLPNIPLELKTKSIDLSSSSNSSRFSARPSFSSPSSFSDSSSLLEARKPSLSEQFKPNTLSVEAQCPSPYPLHYKSSLLPGVKAPSKTLIYKPLPFKEAAKDNVPNQFNSQSLLSPKTSTFEASFCPLSCKNDAPSSPSFFPIKTTEILKPVNPIQLTKLPSNVPMSTQTLPSAQNAKSNNLWPAKETCTSPASVAFESKLASESKPPMSEFSSRGDQDSFSSLPYSLAARTSNINIKPCDPPVIQTPALAPPSAQNAKGTNLRLAKEASSSPASVAFESKVASESKPPVSEFSSNSFRGDQDSFSSLPYSLAARTSNINIKPCNPPVIQTPALAPPSAQNAKGINLRLAKEASSSPASVAFESKVASESKPPVSEFSSNSFRGDQDSFSSLPYSLAARTSNINIKPCNPSVIQTPALALPSAQNAKGTNIRLAKEASSSPASVAFESKVASESKPSVSEFSSISFRGDQDSFSSLPYSLAGRTSNINIKPFNPTVFQPSALTPPKIFPNSLKTPLVPISPSSPIIDMLSNKVSSYDCSKSIAMPEVFPIIGVCTETIEKLNAHDLDGNYHYSLEGISPSAYQHPSLTKDCLATPLKYSPPIIPTEIIPTIYYGTSSLFPITYSPSRISQTPATSVSYINQTPTSSVAQTTSNVVSSITKIVSDMVQNVLSSYKSNINSAPQNIPHTPTYKTQLDPYSDIVKPKSKPEETLSVSSVLPSPQNPVNTNSILPEVSAPAASNSPTAKLLDCPYQSSPFEATSNPPLLISSPQPTATILPTTPLITFSSPPICPPYLPSPSLPSYPILTSPLYIEAPVFKTKSSKKDFDAEKMIELMVLAEILNNDETFVWDDLDSLLAYLSLS